MLESGDTVNWAGRIFAEYHFFLLCDGPGLPAVPFDWSNGVLDAQDDTVVLFTGISSGGCAVAVQVRSTAPGEAVTDGWDDVVETSYHSRHGQLRMNSVLPYSGGGVPNIGGPLLTPDGPGDYRLRVHVRGRDTMIDGVPMEGPVEDYLLLIWPAPDAPVTVYKATDRYGASVRQQPTEPRGPRPVDSTRDAQEEFLRRGPQSRRP